jgi:TRAP-type C4-dicarboxylate transport system permease large subunit/TRAP-type C4-dicarboxylate transport system permease small subunit
VESNPLSRFVTGPFLLAVDATAAVLFAGDLVVVLISVLYRYVLNDPVEWADDVARGLLVGLSFFGAASALARGENVGIEFFVAGLSGRARGWLDAGSAIVIVIVTVATAMDALALADSTAGQTSGSGLPLNPPFYEMAVAALCMSVFAIERICRHRLVDFAIAAGAVAALLVVWALWLLVAPDTMPAAPIVMLAVFVLALVGGVPIGFVLALSTLVFIWYEGTLPGIIFAQQMARGIDNFVLLAIPFFILVGYMMEANGMSVRLIELLQRGVGRLRGGLNVVMVLAMVIFSGISGSKMADVAAVGSVLIPAARRAKQNPGNAVALLAASAVMAETIPPCINLIILGFVANISIGGLFVAGLLPAGLMALALIAVAIAFGTRSAFVEDDLRARTPLLALAGSALVSVGLILIIFVGFRSGFATATEISAFAVLYSLVVGGIVFRELSWAWMFMLLSIFILIIMGSVLEGAAALIIFGPLLVPVAAQLGIAPLHYGVVLVISMGVGLFAPPLGLGLYGSCLIGGVPIEVTVKPMMKYLGLLFLCLLVIAFVPALTLWLPHSFGY